MAELARDLLTKIPEGGIGELSDGYHTFNDLYEQRLYLTIALVDAYPERSWKSKRHEDGSPCFNGEYFIVGIDTPRGSYTYHYELKHWYKFTCQELETAKHWDGHTSKDVNRLQSLYGCDITTYRCTVLSDNPYDDGDPFEDYYFFRRKEDAEAFAENVSKFTENFSNSPIFDTQIDEVVLNSPHADFEVAIDIYDYGRIDIRKKEN